MVSMRFAVRESPVWCNRDVPAPTSTLAATTFTAAVSTSDAPPLFVTLTRALYVPSAE